MNKDFLRFDDELATHRLVLLHGWGADLEDLLPLGKALMTRIGYKFELVALRAPEAHPNGEGRQWYQLFPADWSAVPTAINHLQNRIKALETKTIPLQQTIVLGFSQGGAMALGACCDLPLAGIIACSSYPHPGWRFPSDRPKIFMTHGTFDEIVPLRASNALLNDLKQNNINVDLFTFNGGHEIPLEAIEIISSTIAMWLS